MTTELPKNVIFLHVDDTDRIAEALSDLPIRVIWRLYPHEIPDRFPPYLQADGLMVVPLSETVLIKGKRDWKEKVVPSIRSQPYVFS